MRPSSSATSCSAGAKSASVATMLRRYASHTAGSAVAYCWYADSVTASTAARSSGRASRTIAPLTGVSDGRSRRRPVAGEGAHALDERGLVDRGEAPVADDRTAVDPDVRHRLGRHRVDDALQQIRGRVQGGVAEVHRHEVGGATGRDRPGVDVEEPRALDRTHGEGLFGGHARAVEVPHLLQ